MAMLVCPILLLLLAPATLGQEPAGKAAVTQEIYEALDEKLREGGYYDIKNDVFKNSNVFFFHVSTKNITKMVERLAKRFDEIRNYLLSDDLTLVNSTRGVRVCCDNKLNLNLKLNEQLPIMVTRQETCVVRRVNGHHIGNLTIKKMPTDIRYIVTVTSVKTGETVLFPSTDICHSDLGNNRLESTDNELLRTRPKDLVIVLDMSRTMNQSLFKDSKEKWLDAQHYMLKKIFDSLSDRDRVIVVAMQSGRKFTTHNEDSCRPNKLDNVYKRILRHFEMLARNDSQSDNTNSDLSALINQLEEVFHDFPILQHKRDKIAVIFVASKNVSEENKIDPLIENQFLKRITLLSVCVGNIPGSNRSYTTDAVIKAYLKSYGSYLGVSSMDVAEGFVDWFKKSILPTGTILSSTGLFPGIDPVPVLKMCYRKEHSFVCLLVPVADIHRTIKLSKYIKSYWILLDEFCRVLIHPKSLSKSGGVSDDLSLYESKFSINISAPGCNIISEKIKKEVGPACKKIRNTNLTLCLIAKVDDKQIELYPKRGKKEGSSNTPTEEEPCLYDRVILSIWPTATENSDSLEIQPAVAENDRLFSPSKLEPKNNIKSLRILKDSIGNPARSLSTFAGFIDGVFIMDPGSSHTLPVDYTTKQWFQVARQNPNKTIVLPPYIAPNIWSIPTITIARSIMMERLISNHAESERSYHLFGVFGMVFDFDTFKMVFERVLSKLCSSVHKSCFIIDQDGFIIYPQKVDLLLYHREKFHITVQEPTIARFLLREGILQKSYCTDIEVNQKIPMWKVGPIVGSKNFGRKKTIYSISQTNLYVVGVDQLHGPATLPCDCRNNGTENDLCSCPIQLGIEPCKVIELPEICPPAHPDRFKAVEIKPSSISWEEREKIKRCRFLDCIELTRAGEITCLENKCYWCKVNHMGEIAYVCSEEAQCSFTKTRTEVAASHPSEMYIWIGVAGAAPIILLLCVIMVCHIRTYLRDRVKPDQDHFEVSSVITRDIQIFGYPPRSLTISDDDPFEIGDSASLGPVVNPYEPVIEVFSLSDSTHSRRQRCSSPSSSVFSSVITGDMDTFGYHPHCPMCHQQGVIPHGHFDSGIRTYPRDRKKQDQDHLEVSSVITRDIQIFGYPHRCPSISNDDQIEIGDSASLGPFVNPYEPVIEVVSLSDSTHSRRQRCSSPSSSIFSSVITSDMDTFEYHPHCPMCHQQEVIPHGHLDSAIPVSTKERSKC